MGPQRDIVRTEDRGQNTRVHLSCGHSKLYGKRDRVPVRPHCAECPKDDE